MDFEQIIAALRENDQASFAKELKKLDASVDLTCTNSVPFANWFTGIGANLLQLTAFVRPAFADQVLETGVAIDLHTACALGDVAAIHRLLTKNPDAIEQTIDTYYPIQFALRHPAALRALLEHGDNPNRPIKKLAWFEWENQAAQQGLSDWRPIHMLALGRGDEPHIESAEVLRNAGANFNAISAPLGEAPIHLAAIYNRTHLIRWFVENGCDVDSRTQDAGYNSQASDLFDMTPFTPFHTRQQTPLMMALGEGQSDAVELLLQLGARVNSKDSSGFTPLHFASAPFWKESPKQVEWLLEQGANVNAKSKDGRRPIDVAIEKKYDKTVSILSLR